MLKPVLYICPINKVMEYVSSGKANAVLTLLSEEELKAFYGKEVIDEAFDYEYIPGNNFEGIEKYIKKEDWKIIKMNDVGSDETNPPTETTVKEGIDFGVNEINKGKKLLVHCQMGFSRSPAMAYLILCNFMEPIDAINYVYEIRPNIKPNSVIVEIGDKVLGLNGAAIKALQDRMKVRRTMEESFKYWF